MITYCEELSEGESQPVFTPISAKRKPSVPTYGEQTDNGSEFALEFERATAKLGIGRYFSRVKTPKDNPEIERFHETLEYEWLYNFNLSLDPEGLNPRLTEWLIEYNFNRPHQSLAYLSPVEYIEKELAKIRSPVLPMWSASTRA